MFSNVDFLSDDQLPTVISDFILDSSKSVILCTPWLESENHVFDKLIDAKRADKEVLVITREPSNLKHKQACEKLQAIDAEIFYINKLHSKMIIRDWEELLVCSTNIVERSLSLLHEVGIKTNKRSVVEAALQYTEFLVANAEKAHSNKIGFCVACGKNIDFDRSKPLCKDCYFSLKDRSATFSFCHRCKESAEVRFNTPICNDCHK